MFNMFGVCNICTHFARQTTRYSREEKKNRTLVNAARNGHNECIEKLLKAGANVNYECKSGNTALWHAMHRNKQNCADILIEAGANVNKEYGDGTLLAWSATQGFARNIAKLLKARADMNPSDSYLPIIEAVRGGQEFCLKQLIRAGAGVNCKDRCGETALMVAAEEGKVGCLQALLYAGADVKIKTSAGESVLMKALTKTDNADCVRLLIKKGAEVNSKDRCGESALFYAVLHTCEQSTRVLIEEGADVNMAVNQGSDAGLTPLIRSAGYGNINCVRMLLRAGAYVNKTLQNDGPNAIEYFLCHNRWPYNRQKNEDLLKLLLVAGERTTDHQIMKLVFDVPAGEVKDLEQLGFEEEQNINLMCKCRDAIRSHISATNHINMFSAVAQLDLPKLMRNYLLYNLSLEEKE